jgi:hypothetical protein
MNTTALAKQEAFKKEQQEQFTGYMGKRAVKFGVPQNQGPFA